jgi:hypothetical protein
LRPGGYAIITTPNARAKKAFEKMAHDYQMVEAWSTPPELRALFRDRFVILNHHTFVLAPLYSGLYILRNSPKMRSVLKALGVLGLYDAIWEIAGVGLFQCLMVRKKLEL